MPQSTNVLSFISPHSGEATSRKGSLDPIRPRESGEDALRRITEAALSATGASGAALALQESGTPAEGIFVCVARAGEMAPPIGAKLDSRSGISGASLRTGEALRCEDTETDSRVDRQACRALGLRSLAIAPVKRSDAIVGILEVFSALPDAFTSRHLDVLRQLTELVLDDFEDAPEKENAPTGNIAHSAETKSTPTLVSTARDLAMQDAAPEASVPRVVAAEAAGSAVKQTVPVVQPAQVDFSATLAPNDVNIAAYMAAEEAAHGYGKNKPPFPALIGLACVLLAVVPLFLVWRYMATQERKAASNPTFQSAAISPVSTPANTSLSLSTAKPSLEPNTGKPDAGIPAGRAASAMQVVGTRSGRPPLTEASARDVVRRNSDIGGDNTGDVARPIRIVNSDRRTSDPEAPPALNAPSESGQALTSLLNVPASLPQQPVAISQGVQGGELERRVEPLYPSQAKTLRQQGMVVLQAFVTETGVVRDVKILSGPPVLGQAAAQAVRQWKYKPFQLNGKPVAMETQVKVDFKLP